MIHFLPFVGFVLTLILYVRIAPVFVQVFRALSSTWQTWKQGRHHFEMERLWSVDLREERANDQGGPYRETVT